MNDRLEKPARSPWLEVLRRLEEQTNIAALALKNSEAMESALRFHETVRHTSLAFSESQLMRSVRNLSETTHLASLAFRESEALKSIEQLTETSRLARLALKESEAVRMVRQFAESSKIVALHLEPLVALKEFRSVVGSNQFATRMLRQSEAARQVASLSNLHAFNALADLDNSPFSQILSFGRDLAGEVAWGVSEVLAELDTQISTEINEKTDFNDLSEKTKKILSYLYHYYLLPLILSVFSTYIMISAEAAKKELESVSTPAEVRSFARSGASKFDLLALRGFRVTTAKSLNFRKSPNVKSEVIASLPLGSLVEVIDRSNRSWLLVEVEVNGVLTQGWIFRRYTAYFR